MWPFPSWSRGRLVVRCGESWRDRFYDARAKVMDPVRVAPVDLGEPPLGVEGGYAFERCNLWLLHTALATV